MGGVGEEAEAVQRKYRAVPTIEFLRVSASSSMEDPSDARSMEQDIEPDPLGVRLLGSSFRQDLATLRSAASGRLALHQAHSSRVHLRRHDRRAKTMRSARA